MIKGLKFKICTLIPYMPYQKCSNTSCIVAKGCCYISPLEEELKGYRMERLRLLNQFEKYKTAVIRLNNPTLNEVSSSDVRE